MVPYFGQSAYRCWLTVLECIGGEILCLSSVQMIDNDNVLVGSSMLH